ncbi:MAG: hypothetical protein JNK94_05960 [Hyphomonadaceae bacterium]|nr:hypothetical protein [Hyphomonadaceae bacterium]MBX3510364.1 hypothetical protein [Hyphomonadaceae bacterium]
MRKVMFAALAAACMSGAAFADTIGAAANNTVVITYPNGASVNYHFNEDGTFQAHSANGHVTGAYEITGDQICLTPAGGQRACTPYQAQRGVGETWTQTAADGSTITVEIRAGR